MHFHTETDWPLATSYLALPTFIHVTYTHTYIHTYIHTLFFNIEKPTRLSDHRILH
jgi:hypothetical protein